MTNVSNFGRSQFNVLFRSRQSYLSEVFNVNQVLIYSSGEAAIASRVGQNKDMKAFLSFPGVWKCHWKMSGKTGRWKKKKVKGLWKSCWGDEVFADSEGERGWGWQILCRPLTLSKRYVLPRWLVWQRRDGRIQNEKKKNCTRQRIEIFPMKQDYKNCWEVDNSSLLSQSLRWRHAFPWTTPFVILCPRCQ